MRNRKSKNGERGAILPLLLVVLFGIIEFGFVLYNKAVLTNACREGARAGIVSASPRLSESEIATIVNNYCSTNLISFAATPSAPVVDADVPVAPSFGDDLSVRVDYDYEFLLIPGFLPGVPQPLSLSAETVMKYE